MNEEQYRQYVEHEAAREAATQDPLVREDIEIREFESKSRGRGRKSRRPRDVGFLHHGGTVYQVHGDHLVLPRHKPSARKPDLLAEDVLGDGATEEDLIEHARDNVDRGWRPRRPSRKTRRFF